MLTGFYGHPVQWYFGGIVGGKISDVYNLGAVVVRRGAGLGEWKCFATAEYSG